MMKGILIDRALFVSTMFIFLFTSAYLLESHVFLSKEIYFYFCMASIVYLFVEHGRNRVLIPLLLFSLPYTAYFAPYYLLEIPYHYLTQTQSLELTNNSLAFQHIFYHVFFTAGRHVKPENLKNLDILKLSKTAYRGFAIFMVLMLLLNIAASPPRLGAVYDGSNTSTVWIEYSYVFLVLMVCSKPSKDYWKVTIIILTIYAIYPLLYSRRLQFIMVMLLVYYVFFFDRFKVRTIYFVGIIGFIFLRVLESTRIGVTPTLASLLITTNSEGVVGSNQGGVMVSSTVYLTLIDSQNFDFLFRVKSFFGNLLSGILPSSLNFSETYINLRALEFLPLPGNGGFTAVYFYLWFGLIGVFSFSFFLAKICFPKSRGFFVTPLMLGVLMTFPRLHSYNLLLTVKVSTIVLFFLSVFWISKQLPRKRA